MTMICPNDKTHEVISTADFCGECGGKLIPEHACPRGHSNPRRHKFCYICGLKLEPKPHPLHYPLPPQPKVTT